MNREKIKRAISLLLLCLCILAGCGKQKVEYGNDVNASGTQQTEKGDNNTFDENGETIKENTPQVADSMLAKKLGVDKEWETEWLTASEKFVRVKAEPVLPDADSMQILKIKPRQYGAEDKKRVAEYLFDKDSIFPIINEPVEDDFELGLPGDYSVESYSRTVKGVPYILSFSNIFFDPDQKDRKSFRILFRQVSNVDWGDGKKDTWQYSIYNVEDWDGNLVDFGENKSDMTEEQAKERAYRICDDLDISGLEISSVKNLNWCRYEITDQEIYSYQITEPECNGYQITLERKINGAFVAKEYLKAHYGETDGQNVPEPEMVVITMQDDGIVDMQYTAPMEIVETMSENTELLQFEQVKSRLEEVAIEQYKNCGEAVLFDRLKLTYMCIGDTTDKNIFYYLPVWVLYYGSGDATEQYNYKRLGIEPQAREGVAINAIDGSMINLEKRVEE